MTTFAVHYMKPGVSRDFGMGVKWLTERKMLPTLTTLSETHVFLKTMADFDNGRVSTTGPDILQALEALWIKMQGENWSPNGEARPLIRSKGLQHTSMSVGDAVVVDGEKLYLVDRFGFKLVDEEPWDTDGDTSRWNENGESSEAENDRYASRANPSEPD